MAESGQLHLSMEPISVKDLLSDAVTSFSGHADSEGITLKIANDQDIESLVLNGDLRRLNQILGNLIINAIRHTPSGGTVSLSATLSDACVLLTIQDTGQGIPPDDLPHIFDRFWRGDKSRTHKEGVGGGLGLAITQQLVHLHGGTILVDSEVGKGTTFRLDFPFDADLQAPVQRSPVSNV